jgi:ubiquinone/menaquinone biosynthesis C-methylase UbiE
MSGIRDGMRVLEVATGSGEMFRRLVKLNRSGQTIGFDLSPKMAARTQQQVRREFPNSRTQCHAVDARFLPFRDESFDSVVCCYLLELLSHDDIPRALGEIHRVLRPRGRFTLVCIGQNAHVFNRIYRFAGSMAPAFWGRQVEHCMDNIVQDSNFRILDSRTVTQSGYPSRVITATKLRID